MNQASPFSSYFAPLGELEVSSSPEMRDVDSAFKDTEKHLAYSFQLCNLLGSIYWKVKENCTMRNKSVCEANFKLRGGKIGDRIERLVNYQSFDSAKYWSFIGKGNFDEKDASMAVRKFGLYRICPTPLLQFMRNSTSGKNLFSNSNCTGTCFRCRTGSVNDTIYRIALLFVFFESPLKLSCGKILRKIRSLALQAVDFVRIPYSIKV
jgi:hypothetical protein